MEKSPSVFDYTQPHLFLSDFFYLKKKQNPQFSLRTWSAELGFKNFSHLRSILIGQRPVSEVLSKALIRFFKFSDEETNYFYLLCERRSARSKLHRDLVTKRIVEIRAQKMGVQALPILEHIDFLSDSDLPPLLTLLTFQDVEKTAESLAKILEWTLAKTKTKLEKLQKLGLVEVKPLAQKKVWVPVASSWKVPEHFQGLGHVRFYEETLERAKKAIELPQETRRFRSLFFALNDEEKDQFLQDWEEFVRTQLAKRSQTKLEDRMLFQFNLQLHPAFD